MTNPPKKYFSGAGREAPVERTEYCRCTSCFFVENCYNETKYVPSRHEEGEDQIEKEIAIHFAGSGDGADHAASNRNGNGIKRLYPVETGRSRMEPSGGVAR